MPVEEVLPEVEVPFVLAVLEVESVPPVLLEPSVVLTEPIGELPRYSSAPRPRRLLPWAAAAQACANAQPGPALPVPRASRPEASPVRDQRSPRWTPSLCCQLRARRSRERPWPWSSASRGGEPWCLLVFDDVPWIAAAPPAVITAAASSVAT